MALGDAGRSSKGSTDVPQSRDWGERSVQAIPSARCENGPTGRYRFFFFPFPPFFGMTRPVCVGTTSV
jgi:hypothetical protein